MLIVYLFICLDKLFDYLNVMKPFQKESRKKKT